MFRVRAGVKISSGLSGWRERDPFTAVFREKFRSQGTWRRVTGTNLDKTLDTQQTHKIRHRINFVSESVWPMRGSDIDLMTNKRMGGRLKPLSAPVYLNPTKSNHPDEERRTGPGQRAGRRILKFLLRALPLSLSLSLSWPGPHPDICLMLPQKILSNVNKTRHLRFPLKCPQIMPFRSLTRVTTTKTTLSCLLLKPI